jgi:hypothetical protein
MIKNKNPVTFERALECITNILNFDTDVTPTFRASQDTVKHSSSINFYTPTRDETENIHANHDD